MSAAAHAIRKRVDTMIIYPAIDLRRGKCVRLRQGDPQAETVFGHDPAEMARHWEAHGAQWLHVVNLDGALGDEMQAEGGPVNVQTVKAIRAAVDVPIQFGGGLRTLADIEFLLAAGVSRVILGTVAVRDPDLLRQAVAQFGASRIVVGLDTRDGMVAIHGWQEQSQLTALAVGRRMRDMGVELAIHTDIGQDAMMTGVSLAESADLARQTRLQVIASGGVSGLADIKRLLAYRDQGIGGVITGQALYTGALDLRAALALVARTTAAEG